MDSAVRKVTATHYTNSTISTYISVQHVFVSYPILLNVLATLAPFERLERRGFQLWRRIPDG